MPVKESIELLENLGPNAPNTGLESGINIDLDSHGEVGGCAAVTSRDVRKHKVDDTVHLRLNDQLTARIENRDHA